MDALPRTYDDIADFHLEEAEGLRSTTLDVLDAVAAMFGVATAEAMAVAFVLQADGRPSPHEVREKGWRDYLDRVDWVHLSQPIRDCLCYGVDGAAPRERDERPREARVLELRDVTMHLLGPGKIFLPEKAALALEMASARFALDFGEPLTVRALQLLAHVSYAAVRNAGASGEVTIAANGTVDHEQGRVWLTRRRGFLPSRWLNPSDDQEPISTDQKDGAVIQVPQSEDGPFLPDTAVRRNRKSGGIHVTIGPKGNEESVSDFFEAVDKLARMPTPRWRRRNAAGNWGIVRARGAWLSVPTELVRQQLAAFAASN